MGSKVKEQVLVKDSEIHGRGLFTKTDIKTGEEIMIISGEVISPEECERRENEENNVYIFWNGDDCYIDTSRTNEIKYINHNCDFNCDIVDRNETSLLLVAYRDIKGGEELTIDYGYDEIYENCSCSKCIYREAI